MSKYDNHPKHTTYMNNMMDTAHFDVLSHRFVYNGDNWIPIRYNRVKSGRNKRIQRFLKRYSRALKLHGYLR